MAADTTTTIAGVFRFQGEFIQEVREYMDTQLVTETFGADETS